MSVIIHYRADTGTGFISLHHSCMIESKKLSVTIQYRADPGTGLISLQHSCRHNFILNSHKTLRILAQCQIDTVPGSAVAILLTIKTVSLKLKKTLKSYIKIVNEFYPYRLFLTSFR